LSWLGLPSWAGAALIYLGLGLAVGLLLRRAGQPWSTAASALLAWPLLLGLLGERQQQPEPGGPKAGDIARSFEALEELLEQQRQQGVVVGWAGELGDLRRSLEAVDARIAMVDRILDDLADGGEQHGVSEDLEALARARQRAAGELEAVLGGVQRLRIQVGLLALSEIRDEAAQAVQQRLRELHARARAIEELSSLGPEPTPLRAAASP
jgi:hypothetical protein